MSILKFSDNETFDTSGPLRLEYRRDGWYVIGQGLLMPVDNKEQGQKYIKSKA